MSLNDDFKVPEKRIRFRPPSKDLFCSESKIDDLLRSEMANEELDNKKG